MTMDPAIVSELRAALSTAIQAQDDCNFYSMSAPFEQTREAHEFLHLAMKHMDDLLSAVEETPPASLVDAFEDLLAAVEFEAPPIADGVGVEKRAAILMRCASEARAKWNKADQVSDESLSLLTAVDTAMQEIRDIKSALTDPHAVHINMLHGGIAKLSINSCLHIHGATSFDGWEDMTIREIEAKIAERRAAA